MAKPKKKKTKKEQKPSFLNEFSINKYIPQKYQTPALLGIILLIFLLQYSPIFFGDKTFQSGDIITSNSSNAYLDKDREGYSLWFPYIFCGMPAYGIAVDFKWFNMFSVALSGTRNVFADLFNVEYAKWIFYLIILAFTSFFLIKELTQNNKIALFTSIATSFSTGIVLFLLIGHVTKLSSLCFYPLIFLMILKLEEKLSLKYILILTIALQMFVHGWHVQIIFYTLLSLAIYYLYNILYFLYKKQNNRALHFIKSGLTFSGAAIVALLIQADNLTQIYEYNPYSTRGSKSILESKTDKESIVDSDFYNYATNWSFSPQEITTFIIPSYYGFGNSTYNGPLSQGQDVKVNTYFGPMTSVDLPMYMGVLVFFLTLFSAIINWRIRFVQYLVIVCLFSLVVSFGRNFSVIYDLMYNYFPFFNKFRVPSMILILVQISVPILAALGLKEIIEAKNPKLKNIFKYAAYIFSGVLVLAILGNSIFVNAFSDRLNSFVSSIATNQAYANQFRALSDYMKEMYKTDLIFAIVFLFAASWLIYGYLNKKVSTDLLLIAITLITVIDLIRINDRGAEYKNNPNFDDFFKAPEYVTKIKSIEGDKPYRILNLERSNNPGTVNRNLNFHAAFLVEDFYGYSSIKPRTYQDIVEVIGIQNQNLWRMLNIKYLFTSQPIFEEGFEPVLSSKERYLYKNNNALPRAYLVDSVARVDNLTALQEIKKENYDPKVLAFVHNEDLNVDKPNDNAYSKITSYSEAKISIEVNSTGNNFLFFGTTYLPTGWNAYVDNVETNIHQTNHGFMGIVVPQGKHKVEFIYLPASFVISKYISFILSGAILILLLLILIMEKRKKT